jgi:hypothetical protein
LKEHQKREQEGKKCDCDKKGFDCDVHDIPEDEEEAF